MHSVGFAPADQISGNIEECITREGFQITHDVSSYSFSALLKEAYPHMSENSSAITLTYIGSQEQLLTIMLWEWQKLALRLV